MFRYLLNNTALKTELKLNPQEAIAIHYDIPSRNLKNRSSFGITKQLNNIRNSWDWKSWNRISENLMVGTIPEKNECDTILEFTKKSTETIKPLGLIVSVVDYFELGGNVLLLPKMATPEDWEKKGVKHYSLPMMDNGADVPVEAVIRAIDQMRESIQNGHSVYIHCKAGRGRSVMLCAIYLAVFDEACQSAKAEEALEKAMEKISPCRVQAKLDQIKIDKAVASINAIKSIQKNMAESKESKEAKPDSSELKFSLDSLLATTEIKAEIAQLTSFKEIAIYAAFHDAALVGKTQRSDHIRDFFKNIYKATNAEWYFNFHQNAQAFVNARPWAVWDNSENTFFGIGDKQEDIKVRLKLISQFLEEVTAFLEAKLHCEKGQLKKLLIQNNNVEEREPTSTVQMAKV